MQGAFGPCCGLCICSWLQVLTALVPPVWWQKGWARQRVGSVAEAELLSQLAVLLMPNEPIGEMFRRFPSPEGWGGNYLEPDLAAYGVLKDENAALFVEYDGYWRHGEKEGVHRDRKKNQALLDYAPRGSCVIRIGHTKSTQLDDGVLWIQVGSWRRGDGQSLANAVLNIVVQVRQALGPRLSLGQKRSWQLEGAAALRLSNRGVAFTQQSIAAAGFNTSEEIASFLNSEGFSAGAVDKVMVRVTTGISVKLALQPLLKFLRALQLTNEQTAKAVAGFPQMLGLSIERNLKPTVGWLLDVGLSEAQVAKAVAGSPQILSLSIEQNLKPTAQWLLDLGLSEAQVAKAVAGFPPILGLSIEENLKPTVQWLLDLGLSEAQVAKAVAWKPQILGYSIEENLKPTVRWLLGVGLSQAQVTKAVAGFPQNPRLEHRGELEANSAVAVGPGAERGSSCKGCCGVSSHPWLQH